MLPSFFRRPFRFGMTTLEKQLRDALRRWGIGADEPVVAAVSGGADSTAMLDALVRSGRRRIVVAHLNHALRGAESDGDETFVRQLAARHGLEAVTERLAVADQAREWKQNLEAAARELRYGFLRRVAEARGLRYVLSAHTRDDQAETVLMRLLRGSGAEGLRGIAPARPLGERVTLARPMLAVSRADVLAYCERHELEFRTDSSNLSPDFTRNRIRMELLPRLRDFNPRGDDALARAAAALAEDDACLGQLADELLAAARTDGRLAIAPLGEAHAALRRRVLRRWLREGRGGLERIGTAHLAAIEGLLLHGQSGRRIELPGGWLVTREFGELQLSRPPLTQPDPPQPVRLREGETPRFGRYEFRLIRHFTGEAHPLDATTAATASALLRESAALDDLLLRARQPGDAYAPAGGHRAVKLKTVMIRHKLSLSLRDAHPLLVTSDGRLIWSPGLPVARDFAPNGGPCALILAHESLNP